MHGTDRRPRLWRLLGISAAALCTAARVAASDVYLAPDEFVRSAFGGQAPAPCTLWPGAALQKRMQAVLGHP